MSGRSRQELLRVVYDCDFCKDRDLGFELPDGKKGFYKFPPTIGAKGQAPLLFVGINPRKSETNLTLHTWVMEDFKNFEQLSGNRAKDDVCYICPSATEPHYRDHLRIVEAVWGPDARFETHAAVTELFFCATKNAKGLPCNGSPCATNYFKEVFLHVRPRVVVCVGWTVLRHFQVRFHGGEAEEFGIELAGHSAHVVRMDHPRKRDRETRLSKVIEVIDQRRG